MAFVFPSIVFCIVQVRAWLDLSAQFASRADRAKLSLGFIATVMLMDLYLFLVFLSLAVTVSQMFHLLAIASFLRFALFSFVEGGPDKTKVNG